MSDRSPYSVPKEPGRWRALALAALVHLALLAFLWIGVRWQNETPATIEAEVWSPQPREAAPQPQPEPEPVKQPQPEPEPPKPAPPEPPKAVVRETPVAKPDIALEQEKKRKEEARKRREEEEHQAEIRKQKELKAEEEKLAKRKEEERKEQERKRQAEDKRKEQEEKLAKQKQEQEKAKKAAEAKRKQQEADEKLMAKMREEDMKRITGAVAGTGGSGDAPKSQGGRADAGYAGRVAAKIKSNIVFNVPEGLASNPPVEYVVDLLPDGSVAGIRKTKSSGIPGFDEAVYNAIRKSEPYPKDKSGSVPSSFIGIHRPKDQ